MGTRSGLSKEATQGYWEAVCQVLQKEYRQSKSSSQRAVAKYKKVLMAAGVGDELYHAPIDETAKGIIVGGYVSGEGANKTAKRSRSTPRDIA